MSLLRSSRPGSITLIAAVTFLTGSLPNVAGILESHGIVVLRLPLDTAGVGAFCLPCHDRPAAVLATGRNNRARSRFTAAADSVILSTFGGSKRSQARAFAAAFLTPDRAIRDEAVPGYADWPMLFDSSAGWQVSLAALLLRAKNPGPMTDASYLTAVKARSARGRRRQEPIYRPS